MEDANLNYAESNRVSILTVDKFSRRMVLQFLGFNHCIVKWKVLAYQVFKSDIVEGEGPEAHDGDLMIVGLKEVLTGMRVGGKRRALIPPSVGYVNENLQPMPEEFGPRRSLFPHAQ
ncbi:Peptidyl-prolyl cis-trans isomerase FKBP16-1, chloroplastic [Glycine soja]